MTGFSWNMLMSDRCLFHSKLAFTILLVIHTSRLVAGDCCSDYSGYNGAQHIECPNINSPDAVDCVQNYLTAYSQTWPGKPLDIYFTNCDATLFNDFFASYYVFGLQLNDCGLTEVPYRLFGYLCSKLVNGIRLDDNSISRLMPGGFANCTNMQLLEINNNKIVILSPDSLQGLQSLASMYLTSNSLSSISGFGDASMLMQLYLDHNRISSISKDAFEGMSMLNELHLDYNDIVLMEEGTLDGLHPNIHNFGENPFYCNCSLKWFQDWLNEYPSTIEGATCDEPVQGPVQYTEFCSDTTAFTNPPTAQTTTFQAKKAEHP